MVAESPELDSRTAVRLHALTGLRFYAALAVFLRHAVPAFLPLSGLYQVAMIGPVGVSFFFVLSGFVLAWSDRSGEAKSTFYFNRFARIYPLHLATTVLAIAVSSHAAQNYWQSTALTIPLFQGWVSEAYRVGGNSPSWSLSCEMFFYACFPFLYPRIASLHLRGLMAIIGATFTVMTIADLAYIVATLKSGRDLSLLSPYTFPPLRLLEFIAGIALARLVKSGWRIPLSIRQTLILCGLGYGMLATANHLVGMKVTQLSGGLPAFLLSALFFPVAMLLVAGCAGAEADGETSWVGNRTHVALGEYSFAFYLVHMPVLILVESLYAPTAGGVIGFALILAISLGLAALGYKLVERPCERVLRGWWRGRQVSAGLAAS